MQVRQVLNGIRPRLTKTFGSRLRGVVLYGSEARGDAQPDSDIDILVLLAPPVRLAEDMGLVTRVLYSLQLEIADRPLHAIPVSAEAYAAGATTALRHAREEGVLL